MSLGEFSLILFAAAIGAGLLGALVGIGGGILIVPLLTIGFGFDIRVAIGASIVSVIATSSGAAAAYVRDHLTNIRIGMLLELATTIGAVSGAVVAGLLDPKVLFLLFGVILIVSIVPMLRKLGHDEAAHVESDRVATFFSLASTYPDARGEQVAYGVKGVPVGFVMMYVAGLVSGLLGIGSGTLKVLAMDTSMGLPIKVSSATSNFMIGVTAAASAGIYFWRGDVAPVVAGPVALGVLLGATIGARFLVSAASDTIRLLFIAVLASVSVEMLLRGAGVA
ncbi:MAG TPA: sulfite exporter TauE/SafE family protein [Dehalococcoidia bacterium]|nr:sulfite exporter TauE/SafE family protein [Dehalococcoidia bacterium]